MKKERCSNIELLRIVAMLMIIVYHIWFHCILIQLPDNSVYIKPMVYKKLFIFDIISPFGQIANAIFIIISGYFLCEKKIINIRKTIKKLLFQNLFITIMLMLLSIYIYKSKGELIVNLVSLNYFNDGSWFIGYYFLIILSAYLFLNKYLDKIDKKQYITFLSIMFALTQLGWSTKIINGISAGLEIYFTGLLLFSFGGFLKKYNPFKNIKTSFFITILFIMAVLTVMNGYTLTSSQIELFYKNNQGGIFLNYISDFGNNHLLPILSATCLFEIFSRIKMKKNKTINFIAESTLMIYLFHDNSFMYSLWNSIEWLELLYYYPIKFIYNYTIWTLGVFEFGIILYIFYKLLSFFVPKMIKMIFVKKNIN